MDLSPSLLVPLPIEELLLKPRTGEQDLVVLWVEMLKPTLTRFDFFPDDRKGACQQLVDLLSSSPVLEHFGFYVGSHTNYLVLQACATLRSLSIYSLRFRCSQHSSIMDLLRVAPLETLVVHGWFAVPVHVCRTIRALTFGQRDVHLDLEHALCLIEADIFNPSADTLCQLAHLPALRNLRLIFDPGAGQVLNQEFPFLTRLEVKGSVRLGGCLKLLPKLQELVLNHDVGHDFKLADLKSLHTMTRSWKGGRGSDVWTYGHYQQVKRHCDFCECHKKWMLA